MNPTDRRLIELCNICDGLIETPNQVGYCDEHLEEMTEAQ